VAQLAKATGRHQTEDAAVPGSIRLPHSHLNGARIFDCVSYKKSVRRIIVSRKKVPYKIGYLSITSNRPKITDFFIPNRPKRFFYPLLIRIQLVMLKKN
jgi:hypothetical protein